MAFAFVSSACLAAKAPMASICALASGSRTARMAASLFFMEPGYTLRVGDAVISGRYEQYVPAVQRQLDQFPGLGMSVHEVVRTATRSPSPSPSTARRAGMPAAFLVIATAGCSASLVPPSQQGTATQNCLAICESHYSGQSYLDCADHCAR